MNAFGPSRLTRVAEQIAQPTKSSSSSSSTKKSALKSTPAAAAASSSSSKPKSTNTSGVKRSRAQDSLFEAESDDENEGQDEQDEEDEEEEQPPRKSQHQQPQHNNSSSSSSSAQQPLRKKPRSAPEELSSKRRVPSGVILTSLPSINLTRKRRDPRFDPLCGDYDASHFNSHYQWMNEEKEQEIEQWTKELKSGRSATDKNKRVLTEEERTELNDRISRTKQSLASTKRTENESTLMKDWKHQERIARKDGKKPFFLKKSEQKKLALASRYLELKSKPGALTKFMEKKTREVKNKDHKYMPREGREERE